MIVREKKDKMMREKVFIYKDGRELNNKKRIK